MKCINCQKELPDQAMFCTGCGKKIPRCPTCGSLLTSRVRFCPKDGTPIPAEILQLIPAAAPAAAAKSFCTRCGKPTAPGQRICDACQGKAAKSAKSTTTAAKKESAGKKKSRLWLILIPVILLLILGLAAFGYFAVSNDWLDLPWLEDFGTGFFQDDEDDRDEDEDYRDDEDEDEDKDSFLSEEAVAETAAPTEAPAEEVPATEASIDYSKLVTDAHNLDCTGKESTYTFRIPQINLPGSNAERINQEIYDQYYSTIADAREYLEEYGFPGTSGEVSYRWAVNGDILSLVIQNYAFPDASGWYEYTVYNLLVPEGTAVSNEKLLSTVGLSMDDFHSAVKTALDTRFRDRYTNFAQDDFYFSQLGRTLADDNIRNTRPYLNDNGQLCVIALEYSLVAGDSYYGDFVLEVNGQKKPEQKPEQEQKQDQEQEPDAVTEATSMADPVYLNELAPKSTNGKLWIRSNDPATGTVHTNSDAPDCWKNTDIPGHTYGTVRDNKGNTYTYGIHVDGSTSKQYTITYSLNGKYTRFSGYCACPEKTAAISAYVYNSSTKYSKYFEIYGDGKLLFTSNSMRYDRKPQFFEVDVTGVEELTILYPTSKGPNEIATLYDGLLE